MDTAVALVQSYLYMNGYFTVTEYPVLELMAGGEYRTVTDVDLLAVHIPGAGRDDADVSGSFVAIDPDLDVDLARIDLIIAEVKGRTFKGTSFVNMSGLECWVTMDDVEGLVNWQKVMGAKHTAVFVFVYHIQNVDVDFDGRYVYELNGNKYVFFAVELDDYRKFMKLRSPKWRTVNLSAENFRECAVQMQQLLY